MSELKLSLNELTSQVRPPKACATMAELRKEIDALDRHLVEVLCLRLGYMERAAEIKDHRNKVRDEERIEDVVQKLHGIVVV